MKLAMTMVSILFSGLSLQAAEMNCSAFVSWADGATPEIAYHATTDITQDPVTIGRQNMVMNFSNASSRLSTTAEAVIQDGKVIQTSLILIDNKKNTGISTRAFGSEVNAIFENLDVANTANEVFRYEVECSVK